MNNKANKIVIYNETPEALSSDEALLAVLDVIKSETESIYGGPYKVGDFDVVTVIQNKNSVSFRVARLKKRGQLDEKG